MHGCGHASRPMKKIRSFFNGTDWSSGPVSWRSGVANASDWLRALYISGYIMIYIYICFFCISRIILILKFHLGSLKFVLIFHIASIISIIFSYHFLTLKIMDLSSFRRIFLQLFSSRGLLDCPRDGPNHRFGAPLSVLGGIGTATLRIVA
jgi:hypothetical protein